MLREYSVLQGGLEDKLSFLEPHAFQPRNDKRMIHIHGMKQKVTFLSSRTTICEPDRQADLNKQLVPQKGPGNVHSHVDCQDRWPCHGCPEPAPSAVSTLISAPQS